MAKAAIKTKSGMKINIEGSEKEIAAILKLVSDSGEPVRQARAKKRGRQISTSKPSKQKFNATDGILELKETGFFNKQKSLIEIKKALSEQGLIYPVTTLSGIVLKLCRKRELRRIRENKKWTYVRGGK